MSANWVSPQHADAKLRTPLLWKEIADGRVLDLVEQCGQPLRIRGAPARQHELLVRAVEELRAEILLELGDLPADRTVRDAQLLGGA
jgi:hypothetical protein